MRASVSASKLRRRRRVCLEVLEDRQLLATITVNTTADDTTAGFDALAPRGDRGLERHTGRLVAEHAGAGAGERGRRVYEHYRLQHPHDRPGIQCDNRGLDDRGAIGAADDQHQRGDHRWLQPARASKNTLAQGDNAKLAIALDGATAGSINGLTVGQTGSQVRGLDIENFAQAGVLITGTGVQVAGCFIGTDPTGETAAPNGAGVILENSSNMIGGPNVADRNVLSGAEGMGVQYFDE